MRPGLSVALYGKAESFRGTTTLVSPEYEIIDNSGLVHMGRVVPIYPETAGVSSKWLRAKIRHLLAALPDPDPWPAPPDLPGWKPSLQEIHFPTTDIRRSQGPTQLTTRFRRRLAFDELLLLSLSAALRKQAWNQIQLSHPFSVDQDLVLRFISSLPFTLTPSQTRSVREILADLSRPHAMNRLLEGDVGSGKTVVAAIAAYVAHLNGFTTLVLAPTQILAAQHHATLSTLFKPFGVEIGLITAASKKLSIVNSQLSIIVGTHALLSQKQPFVSVGLIVIDEQHRFGVAQRALAAQKGASGVPHTLTMTATPIPRSLALTVHGDLDLSVLDEPPSGRLPVKTWAVPESKRQAAYKWINDQMTNGKSQCFIVCPFIENSDTLASVKSATAEYQKLEKVFLHLKLALLHGRLKSRDKDDIINRFRAGEYRILVTTPVVEVGMDIPNAAIMVVEGAERFGLAQLHQLRGRVGRGSAQSYCLLFSSVTTDLTRLKILERNSSGLALSEMDLKLRGPGSLYGTAQSGRLQFKIATGDDLDLIQTAKNQAQGLLPALGKYPVLKSLIQTDKIDLVNPN